MTRDQPKEIAMDDKSCAEATMRDHIERFWAYMSQETVRVVLDLKRTVGTDAPDGPVVYWDSSTYSDEVAKALVAENNRFKAALQEIADEEDTFNYGHKLPEIAKVALAHTAA